MRPRNDELRFVTNQVYQCATRTAPGPSVRCARRSSPQGVSLTASSRNLDQLRGHADADPLGWRPAPGIRCRVPRRHHMDAEEPFAGMVVVIAIGIAVVVGLILVSVLMV